MTQRFLHRSGRRGIGLGGLVVVQRKICSESGRWPLELGC
jgi:hypothetical protein